MKPTKPTRTIKILENEYYWVKPFHKELFEVAACRKYYGTELLYFYFTNGSRMEAARAWDVLPLENINNSLK